MRSGEHPGEGQKEALRKEDGEDIGAAWRTSGYHRTSADGRKVRTGRSDRGRRQEDCNILEEKVVERD